MYSPDIRHNEFCKTTFQINHTARIGGLNQLSFDQPEHFVARLHCESQVTEVMFTSVDLSHLLLNVFVTGNSQGKSIGELSTPEKHVNTTEECIACHVANDTQLVSILDYAYPNSSSKVIQGWRAGNATNLSLCVTEGVLTH